VEPLDQAALPGTPYILVGMKSDFPDSFSERTKEYRAKRMESVFPVEGEEMKKAIGAHAYIECSSKILYNLKEVFETAIKIVLHPPSAKQKSDAGRGCEVA
jgi:Ras-related C3 botulinum toxin substrate 1